jgi:hypothetical protein
VESGSFAWFGRCKSVWWRAYRCFSQYTRIALIQGSSPANAISMPPRLHARPQPRSRSRELLAGVDENSSCVASRCLPYPPVSSRDLYSSIVSRVLTLLERSLLRTCIAVAEWGLWTLFVVLCVRPKVSGLCVSPSGVRQYRLLHYVGHCGGDTILSW